TGVVLNDSVMVTDSLTLTNGIVFTSSANILIVANGARSISGSSVSFVDGPVKKTGSQAFTFPIRGYSYMGKICNFCSLACH
ncbi:MAG: hypothetical protein IIA88_11945, partial [Bacteroidetes bacterium]|nr:hypothetical protein [Bacteroidota bacterium]